MERFMLLFVLAVLIPTSNAECISPSGVCNCNVVFLLDISGSVSDSTDASGQSELGNLKRFTKDMVDRFYNIQGSINVGVVTFENGATIVAPLGLSRSDVKSKIDGIQQTVGYTNYIAAFEIQRTMMASVSRVNTYNSVILVTDGQPTIMYNGSRVDENDDSDYAKFMREETKRRIKSMVDIQKREFNLKVATVRVSKTSDNAAKFLKTLASSSEYAFKGEDSPNSLFFEDFGDLNNATYESIKNSLVQFTCADQSQNPIICPNGASSSRGCSSNNPCNSNEFCHYSRSGDNGGCCPEEKCGISRTCHCNIGFLLDISGSVSDAKDNTGMSEIDNLKTFTKDMVNRYYSKSPAADVNIAVVTFDNFAKPRAVFGNSKQQVLDGIDGISATNGWTNYIDALIRQKSMFDNFARNNPYMDSIILITDGAPTVTKNGVRISETDTRDFVIDLKNEMKSDIKLLIDSLRRNRNDPNPFNLIIIRVSITSEAATAFLQSLASEDGDAVFRDENGLPVNSLQFEDFAALNNLNSEEVKQQIADLTCKVSSVASNPVCPNAQMSISGCSFPSGSCPDGYQCLENPNNQGSRGMCCAAMSCEDSTTCNCNIGFLLDISGSVSGTKDSSGLSEIDNLKKFTKDLVNRYYGMANKTVNTAVITFDNYASIKAKLGDSRQVVVNGIDSITATNGWTNYIDALTKQKSMFQNFPHNTPYMDTVILITDGQPTVTKNGVRIEEDDMRDFVVQLRNEMKADIKELISSQRKQLRSDPNPFNLIIVRVSWTSDAATTFLQSIASETGDMVLKDGPESLEFDDFAALNNLNAEAIKQQIIEATCKSAPIRNPLQCEEVIILADMSGSMEKTALDRVKTVLYNLFKDDEMLNRKTSLLAFSDNNVTVVLPSKMRTSNDRNEINSEIQEKLFSGGWTGMANALHFIDRNMYTSGSHGKLIILLTDGFPTIMINGRQIDEHQPPNDRKLVEDEVHQMKSTLTRRNAKFAAICLGGTQGRQKDFLEELIGDNNKISDMESYMPFGDEYALKNKAVDFVRTHC